MPAADPYATLKPMFRVDTSNLIGVVGLAVVVLSLSLTHGFLSIADAIYLGVLGLLACRYLLSRVGVAPLQRFEVSRIYTVAVVLLIFGGYAVLSKIPALQKPM